MLCLSRKRNETIKIGHDITMMIIEIRGDKVRLGFEAPADVEIHRSEIYDAIQRDGHLHPINANRSDQQAASPLMALLAEVEFLKGTVTHAEAVELCKMFAGRLNQIIESGAAA